MPWRKVVPYNFRKMVIGGIQKTSLIDFPAKISCVIFTAGCNFDCPYCHNAELVSPPFTTIIDPEDIFAFLAKRKNLLDGVVITGGEPTLQQNLPEFCDRIKSLGFPIKMDTNGSRPDIIQSLLETNRIDYIAMDIKTLPEKYSPSFSNIIPNKIYDSIHIIKNSGKAHEFRTTCVKPFADDNIISQISRIIEGADLYVLQKANIDKSILHPYFFENRDWNFDMEELTYFQKTAAASVKKVSIR